MFTWLITRKFLVDLVQSLCLTVLKKNPVVFKSALNILDISYTYFVIMWCDQKKSEGYLHNFFEY